MAISLGFIFYVRFAICDRLGSLDVSAVNGFYGPGAFSAWMATALSLIAQDLVFLVAHNINPIAIPDQVPEAEMALWSVATLLGLPYFLANFFTWLVQFLLYKVCRQFPVATLRGTSTLPSVSSITSDPVEADTDIAGTEMSQGSATRSATTRVPPEQDIGVGPVESADRLSVDSFTRVYAYDYFGIDIDSAEATNGSPSTLVEAAESPEVDIGMAFAALVYPFIAAIHALVMVFKVPALSELQGNPHWNAAIDVLNTATGLLPVKVFLIRLVYRTRKPLQIIPFYWFILITPIICGVNSPISIIRLILMVISDVVVWRFSFGYTSFLQMASALVAASWLFLTTLILLLVFLYGPLDAPAAPISVRAAFPRTGASWRDMDQFTAFIIAVVSTFLSFGAQILEHSSRIIKREEVMGNQQVRETVKLKIAVFSRRESSQAI
jgi:hypothetical protein